MIEASLFSPHTVTGTPMASQNMRDQHLDDINAPPLATTHALGCMYGNIRCHKDCLHRRTHDLRGAAAGFCARNVKRSVAAIACAAFA
jgi:hypothetical protein